MITLRSEPVKQLAFGLESFLARCEFRIFELAGHSDQIFQLRTNVTVAATHVCHQESPAEILMSENEDTGTGCPDRTGDSIHCQSEWAAQGCRAQCAPSSCVAA